MSKLAKGLLRFSLYSIASLMLATAAFSQQTIVTAHVQDPRGFDYQAGYGQSSIQCFQNSQPYFNRSPLTRSIPIPALDGTGSFTQTLWDTSTITDTNGAPLSCQWQISIHDHCAVATFSVLVTGVTGSGPVNLSSQINAAAVNLSPACTPPGIVNSVTLGNLPPLFNTSVSGNPLNPSFTFAQIPVAAGTIYGNPSGGSAVPSFNLPSAFGSFGTVTNIATTSPISGGPITTTGTISCPTCVTSVSGTANQVTSSGGTTPTVSIPATFIAPGSIQATTSVTATTSVSAGTSVTGASITDTGLTANRCVQTTTGGLLGVTTTPCVSPSGFSQISTASAGGCSPGSSNSYDACLTTLTWSTPFADTGYFPSCTGLQPLAQSLGSGSNLAPMLIISSFSTSQIVVITQQERSITSNFSTIYCVGVHP